MKSLIQPSPPSTVWHRGEKECNDWPCVWYKYKIACVNPQVAHHGLRVLVQACKCANDWAWVWASCTQMHVGITEAALDLMCTWVQTRECHKPQHDHWCMNVNVNENVRVNNCGCGHCTCKHASACKDQWCGTHANQVKQKSGVNDRGWERTRPQQRERT